MKFQAYRRFLVILVSLLWLSGPILAQSVNLADRDITIDQLTRMIDRWNYPPVITWKESLSIDHGARAYDIRLPELQFIGPRLTYSTDDISLTLRAIRGRDWPFTIQIPDEIGTTHRQGGDNPRLTIAKQSIDGTLDDKTPIIKDIHFEFDRINQTDIFSAGRFAGGIERRASAGDQWLAKGRFELSNLETERIDVNSIRLQAKGYQRFIAGGGKDSDRLITDDLQFRSVLRNINQKSWSLRAGQMIQKIDLLKQGGQIHHDILISGRDISANNATFATITPTEYRGNLRLTSRPVIPLSELDLITDWLINFPDSYIQSTGKLTIENLDLRTPASPVRVTGQLSIGGSDAWLTGSIEVKIANLDGFMNAKRDIAQAIGFNFNLDQIIERRGDAGRLNITFQPDRVIMINGVRAANLPPANR
jgi:hypothetical protein